MFLLSDLCQIFFAMFLFPALSGGGRQTTASFMAWLWMRASATVWAPRDLPKLLWTWTRSRYTAHFCLRTLFLKIETGISRYFEKVIKSATASWLLLTFNLWLRRWILLKGSCYMSLISVTIELLFYSTLSAIFTATSSHLTGFTGTKSTFRQNMVICSLEKNTASQNLPFKNVNTFVFTGTLA